MSALHHPRPAAPIATHPASELLHAMDRYFRHVVAQELAAVRPEPAAVRLAELRAKKGYTRSELAHLARVSKTYVGDLERGEVCNPGFAICDRLARALDVEPSAFRAMMYSRGRPRSKGENSSETES